MRVYANGISQRVNKNSPEYGRLSLVGADIMGQREIGLDFPKPDPWTELFADKQTKPPVFSQVSFDRMCDSQ